jgi:hypothetical protein
MIHTGKQGVAAEGCIATICVTQMAMNVSTIRQ